MDISMFKIFQIFGIVSSWASKALADGKITIEEAVALAVAIAGILGIAMEVEVPIPGAPETEEEEDLFKTLPVKDERSGKPTQKPVED